MFSRIITVVAVLWTTANGFKNYQHLIPNGDRVPHPCKPNYIWHGVGHLNVEGGGARNPFGLHFNENGKKWDTTLCQKDSDGDGKTNGEELGDPDCTWSQGQVPKLTTGISHPGVCEPHDSPECQTQNQWEFCDDTDFKCDPVNATGVFEHTVRFDNTSVPDQETSYVCQAFSLPSDRDYHIIATKPVLDNRYVMHHMVAYGCIDDSAFRDFSSPAVCGMSLQSCRDIIGTWTLGLPGICTPDAYGIKVGKNGFKYMMLQVHWNNPELRSDYFDNSGMTFFMTPNLRPNDGGVLAVGQRHLVLPAGRDLYKEVGNCPSSCTERALGPGQSIYLTTAAPHMHYLGRTALLEHFRGDQRVGELMREDAFMYDSPSPKEFAEPYEFRAGDSLKTTCGFETRSKTKVTYYGDATADEMCYFFLQYYPVTRPLSICVSIKSRTMCNGMFQPSEMGSCNPMTAGNSTEVQRGVASIVASCDVTGAVCKQGCQAAIERARAMHPCLEGDNAAVLATLMSTVQRTTGMGDKFNKALYSCDTGTDTTGGASQVFERAGASIFVLSAMLILLN